MDRDGLFVWQPVAGSIYVQDAQKNTNTRTTSMTFSLACSCTIWMS